MVVDEQDADHAVASVGWLEGSVEGHDRAAAVRAAARGRGRRRSSRRGCASSGRPCEPGRGGVGQAGAVVAHDDRRRRRGRRCSSTSMRVGAAVAHRVGQRLGGDAVGVGGDERRQVGQPAARPSIVAGDASCELARRARAAAGRPARPSSGARSSATLVSMSAVAARSSASAWSTISRSPPSSAAVERGEHEVRGVHALLGRVVQLPRDALALGLRRPAARCARARRAGAAAAPPRSASASTTTSGTIRCVVMISRRTARSNVSPPSRSVEDRDDAGRRPVNTDAPRDRAAERQLGRRAG